MFRLWKRRREAREARESAEQEKARSQRLRDDTRARYVVPLAEIHERNQFSDIIRDALRIGYSNAGNASVGERRS